MDFDYSIFVINYFGNWSYLIVFFVCFIETLAFIGTLIPGGFIVIAIGFLAVYTPLNIWILILVGTIGSISGDTFSYYLGTKGVRWFKYENKLLKLSHLEKGKAFFKKHGHKSIFFGRFVGLIKHIVPFIAGLSKMDFKTFFFWDAIGLTPVLGKARYWRSNNEKTYNYAMPILWARMLSSNFCG